MSGNTRPVTYAVALSACIGVASWLVAPPATATTTPPPVVSAAAAPAVPDPTSMPPRPKPAWVAPLTGTLTVNGDCKVGGQGGHWKARRNDHLHQGVDLYRPLGAPILAIHSGTVVAVHYSADANGIGAGWLVRISHGRLNGKAIYTTSMHANGRPPVKVGQKVAAGELVARVGHSGTGSNHLHFQVHEGGPDNDYTVNPSVFLRALGIEVKGC